MSLLDKYLKTLGQAVENYEAAQHSKQDAGQEQARSQVRESLLPAQDGLGLERINGTNDLIQINYLGRGLRAARAIGRIHIHDARGFPTGFGTGFMISPSLMMTNNHVLEDRFSAAKSRVEFDFEYDSDFRPKKTFLFQLDARRFFHTDQYLDFTIVAVEPVNLGGKALRDFGFLSLIEASGKANVGESVTIIQHPEGSDKQISLRNNEVLKRHQEFIHYETDTMPGSSGSPVFNDQWDVVALHHSGVPKQNSKGQYLKQDGRIWRHGIDGLDKIVWIANEGVRISSIFEHLKAQDWTPKDKDVINELALASDSTLSESMITPHGKPIETSKLQGRSTATLLTPDELKAKIWESDLESDLAPYFTQDHHSGMDPQFTLNESMVRVENIEARESAMAINSANWICKQLRHRRYNAIEKKDLKKRIRIISEGDSWFQYPFLLDDVIDHLMDDDAFAVLSFGDGGDLLQTMVNKKEFARDLIAQKPHFFLASGGGNDMVGEGGFTRFVSPDPDDRDPFDLIQHDAVARLKHELRAHYQSLFNYVLGSDPTIQILFHGYSYAIPADGPWLGSPMKQAGIRDMEKQKLIVKHVMDEMNQAYQSVAHAFGSRVHFLDLRELVPENGWYDELHPNSDYFGSVAAEFKQVMHAVK